MTTKRGSGLTLEVHGSKAAPADAGQPRYVLRLYVTGTTPNSTRAIANTRRICEQHLKGRYDLAVVDISEHPSIAQGEQIIAAPTLIKQLPLPLRRFIGDMSQAGPILLGLDLYPPENEPSRLAR